MVMEPSVLKRRGSFLRRFAAFDSIEIEVIHVAWAKAPGCIRPPLRG